VFRNLGKDKKKFLSLPNTFELFGLDFLVDSSKQVVLLEANPEPSMRMFNKKRSDVEGSDPEALLKRGPGDGFVKAYSLDTDKALAKMKEMIKRGREEDAEREELEAEAEEAASAIGQGEELD
jgi:hypothetical protein